MIFKKNDTFKLTFAVSDELYNGFISIFKDHNPLHTDTGFAISKGFKGRVMHGNILNGFLSYFVGECLPIKNVIIHSQSIKYSQPVYLHDVLQCEATVNDVYESVGAVEFSFSFKNSDSQIVAKGKLQIGILA